MKVLQKSRYELIELFCILSGWQLLILLFFWIGFKLLPLQAHFLGGSENFSSFPLLWAHGNFDGEHYLSISQFGYTPLNYFFFPLYPVVVKFISQYLIFTRFFLAWSGVLVSLLSFYVGFVVFFKLLRLDYSKKISLRTVFLVLLFPTSFFFTSIYTESLFFAVSVSSFYLARKQKWFLAGVFAALASATRVVGLVLFFSLVCEWYVSYKKKETNLLPLISIMLAPLGILSYMYYLNIKASDPLAFFHSIQIYGAHRSEKLILLPQVFYRYIFKILPNLNGYLPTVYVSFLEFTSGVLFLVSAVISVFKIRASYAIFLIFGYLIPTLAGSFSSLPRYVIVLFPAFIIFSRYLDNWPNIRMVTYIGLFICLAVFTCMFAVGFWVS